MKEVTKIKLSAIKGDLTLQGREELHPELIKEYAENVDELPPIDLYKDETEAGVWYFIGNGWHRFMAHERAGRTEIKAHVHEGGREGALLHACRANTSAEHGKTRTNADKRKAIKLYMTHLEWFKHGNNRIAEACKVDAKTVQEERLKLQAAGLIPIVTEREGKDGKTQSATKTRLSISTPIESSQRATEMYNNAEAQVRKSIPESLPSPSAESAEKEASNSAPPKKLKAPIQLDHQEIAARLKSQLTELQDQIALSPKEVRDALGWMTTDSGDTGHSKGLKPSDEPKEPSYQGHNTPDWVRDLFDPMGGIALDPCHNDWSVMRARKTFIEADDGLAQDWLEASEGGLIFINPPYNNVGPWVAKIEQEAKRGAEMVLLVPTSHGTQWWQKAARSCSLMALFNSRVAFTKEGKKNGSPQWETLMFYWGDRAEHFCRAVEHVSFLVREIPRQIYRGLYAKEDPRQVVLPGLAKPPEPKPEAAPITQESAEPIAAPVEVPAVQNVLNKDERHPAKWAPPRYLCLHCGELFDFYGTLASHNKKAHGETTGGVCDVIYGENKWATLTGNYRFEIVKERLGIPSAHNQITVDGVTFSAGEKVFFTSMQAKITSAEIQEAPTKAPEEEKSPKKKRGHKEVEVSCISCQTTTPLAAARSLNDYHICGGCFAKYPPSTTVTIQAATAEGQSAEIKRFGLDLTREEQTYTVTSAEASSLTADKRLVVTIEEMARSASIPLYETPDYFLALIRDAKDQDALDRATDLADAYLPAEVAKQTLRDAITARSAQLKKKEEKASAPKKARSK